jgi:hypothetical protein
VVVQTPSLLLGYVVPFTAGDALFVHYPSALLAPLLVCSGSASSSVASIGIEGLWGRGRSAQLSLSLSLFLGPLTVSQHYGPLHQQQSQEWILAVKEGPLSVSLGVETILGEAVIFSNTSQSLTKRFFSKLRLALVPVRLDLQWVLQVADTPSGERHVSQSLELTLMHSRWSISLGVGSGGPHLAFTASDRRLRLSQAAVEGRFVFRRGGFTLELSLDAKARVRWSWRYTIAIDRGSGSPPQGQSASSVEQPS